MTSTSTGGEDLELWLPLPADDDKMPEMLPNATDHPKPKADSELGNRPFYLPRLPKEYYQADAVVHWTLTVLNRRTGWLTEVFHARFRELMLHAAAREGLACPIYCLMPDHLHLVWMGLRRDSDQHNGMAFLRTHLKRQLSPSNIRFQCQAHDHVLRDEERKRRAFSAVCFYLAENPVRGELVKSPGEWPYTGCVIPGYPDLHPLAEGYWELFWRLLYQLRAPDAGEIKRPPIGIKKL